VARHHAGPADQDGHHAEQYHQHGCTGPWSVWRPDCDFFMIPMSPLRTTVLIFDGSLFVFFVIY
jgi:hypothetical protein